MLEPAQLVDVPLVETVDGDVAEERVAGALRERTGGQCHPKSLSICIIGFSVLRAMKRCTSVNNFATRL